MHTATVSGPACGRNASSTRAVPARLTSSTRRGSCGPGGARPAVWTSAPSGPIEAARSASAATDAASVTSRTTSAPAMSAVRTGPRSRSRSAHARAMPPAPPVITVTLMATDYPNGWLVGKVFSYARDTGSSGTDHASGREGDRVRPARRGRRLRRHLVALPPDGLDPRLGVDRGLHGAGELPGEPARPLRPADDDGRRRRRDVEDQGRRLRDGHDPPPPRDARPGRADRRPPLLRAARSSASAPASA